jgi:signal transduction histidine kinase
VEFGLALIGAIVLALGLLAGTFIAAGVGRPIRRLEAVARRVARGDLSARARLEGSREQRSLADSFNEMTDRISRLLRAQRDFVADASHQLRTPLTGLRLRLEEARALTDGSATDEIDGAIAEVDRLSHTVDELLVLSRGGERQTTGGPLDLAELIQAAAERWQPDAGTCGLRLVARTMPESGPAWGARADVDRALDALIENALRYAPRGSTVEIALCPGGIEVLDRGPGVAPEERELVFERFHRGRAGRGGPSGSGLGLSIARELIRGWGGEVTLDPRAGGGTTATIALPERAPAATGAPVTIGDLPALSPPAASVG